MEEKISIEDEVFSTRLLVFMEVEPQSNQYKQVFLNQEKFKKVSDSIVQILNKEGDQEDVIVDVSDDIYTLPDLQEIHD